MRPAFLLLLLPFLAQCLPQKTPKSQPLGPKSQKSSEVETSDGSDGSDGSEETGGTDGSEGESTGEEGGENSEAKPVAKVTCPKGQSSPEPKALAAPAGSVVTTIASGRVRLRHEKEERFARFGSFYWEKRSFGFEVKDYSLTNDRKLVIIFKPLGPHATDQETGLDGLPNGGFPNIRIFDSGDGNVFHINEQMRDQPSKNVFRYEFKDAGNNPKLKLEPGRIVEFEFGVFFDRKQINSRTDGDTNYYTDTFRIRLGQPGLVAGIPGKVGETVDSKALSGGSQSTALIHTESERYLSLSQNATNLRAENLQMFLEGRSLFHTNFLTGNHSEDGLHFRDDQVNRQKNLAGPAMDSTACSECHQHNARVAKDSSTAPQQVLKIAVKAESGLKAHPDFGLQMQMNERQSLGKKLIKESETKNETFADGSITVLKKDRYRIDGQDVLISQRIPPQVYGLGLLEAISESHILSRQNCDELSGVSGRANYVKNPENGKKELGRFGWKAGKVSLKHQVSEALLFDLGVTNPMMPNESCEKSGSCADGKAEVDDELVKRIISYTQMIAVPVQRNRDNAQFLRGEEIFASTGCVNCHVPKQITGNDHPLEEMRNQVIYPYSDLLLHDLGEGLKDSKAEGDASASEWRTPPLWGLGLTSLVNGQLSLLHDGRAKSFEEAILWHAGEAAGAQIGFKKLPKKDREDLLYFLNGI